MSRHITLLVSSIYLASALHISHGQTFAQKATRVTQSSRTVEESIIEEIEVRGNRRIPRESILYYVQSKPYEPFNISLALRDLQAILQMGVFDPLATKAPDPKIGCTATSSQNCKVLPSLLEFYPIGGDTQFIYNI